MEKIRKHMVSDQTFTSKIEIIAFSTSNALLTSNPRYETMKLWMMHNAISSVLLLNQDQGDVVVS